MWVSLYWALQFSHQMSVHSSYDAALEWQQCSSLGFATELMCVYVVSYVSLSEWLIPGVFLFVISPTPGCRLISLGPFLNYSLTEPTSPAEPECYRPAALQVALHFQSVERNCFNNFLSGYSPPPSYNPSECETRERHCPKNIWCLYYA